MSAAPVHLEQRDDLAIITLSNPPLNLVTLALRQALDDALEQALDIHQTQGVRALIVTGAGEKAFCCGSDVSEFPPLMAPGRVVPGKLGPENATFNKLAAFPTLTIAAVNGLAFGGGLEMACCCDLIVADEAARLCLPEVKLGLIPGSGGAVRLTRRIGEARAREMMLLADPIEAHTALEWGLINRITPRGEALTGALALAARLEGRSPSALSLCKQAIELAFNQSDQDAIANSLPLSDAAFSSPDAREGLRAFLAKETPRFTRG